MIKIGARKCTTKEIDFETTKNFLNKYHRQKSVYSIYNIGLFSESMLIGVMTFGYPRYNKRYQWELLRLCFHQDYRVVGGTQKMFNYFVDEYKPQSIVSYCDYNYFSGDIYEKLGFELLRISKGGKIWKKGDKFITDNLLRKFGADKLIGTNDGKNTNNEEILLREGWTYEIDEKGQGTYVWTGEGKFGYIYLITDTLHNKQYVGQRRGYKLDENYYGSGRIIQDLIKKYGTTIFEREIIDYASSQEELSQKEVEYIEKYNTLYPNGYNLTLRLQAIDPYERSCKHSEEFKRNMSKRLKNMWKNEEYKEKMINISKENWKKEDYRKRIIECSKESWSNKEIREKRIDAIHKSITEETCKKISDKLKERWKDETYSQKHKSIMKNIRDSEEYRKKLSKAAKGKRWWNNGINEIFCYNCPDGFVAGRLSFGDEFKEKRKGKSNPAFGRKWWNNGVIQKFQKEKPEGENWILGQLKKNK